MCQTKYAKDMLQKNDMENYKYVATLISHGVLLSKHDGTKKVDITTIDQYNVT